VCGSLVDFTAKGNTKAAYEGILAIGQQPLTINYKTSYK